MNIVRGGIASYYVARILHIFSSIEVGKMSDDDGNNKMISDFVYSLYQKHKITMAVCIEKLKQIEKATKVELEEVSKHLNIWILVILFIVVGELNRLFFHCIKIVDEFEDIELFSDWVSAQKQKNKNNGSGQLNLENSHTLNDGSDEVEIEDGNEISMMTESVTLCQMNLQEEYYASDEKEELKMDTLKTIQTYVKKIFRQAKFLSDTGSNFKEPNFVNTTGVRSQSVEICEYLWKSLGKRKIMGMISRL